MNAIERWRRRGWLRVAARLNRTGEVSDEHYGALATYVLFALGGRRLKVGDTFSNTDFEITVRRALGLPTGYQWNAAHLLTKFGPYDRALPALAAGNYDTATRTVPTHTWNARTEGSCMMAIRRVTWRGRTRAWGRDVRPTVVSGLTKFLWIVVTAIVGVVAARFILAK